jgi:Holliday junction DNA helicase RuvA
MIARLSGKIISKTPTVSIIDCHGVGYEVFHTPFCAESLKSDTVSVHIYSHIREDAFQLFGFADETERDLFKELLRVSGIGPKMALGILSGIPHQELVSALQKKDIQRLQKIPGIGKKTAERLLVELADRLASGMGSASLAPQGNRETELESVLLNLGYQRSEIQRAMTQVKAREASAFDLPLESLVRTTLRELTQGRSL